jgi:hypothetical protein
MPTLEQLLENAQLTDDIKITLPNVGEVTIGELRLFASNQKAAVADAHKRKADAEAEIAKAQRLATDSLALWEEAQKLKKAPADPTSSNAEIDWDTDPVYKPVGARFKAQQSELADAIEQVKQLKSAFGAGFKFVTEDYNERRWNAIPAAQRPKDKSWRDYMSDAEKGNIRDSHGLFDPIETFNRATAADRRAAEIEDARQKGIKEGEKRGAQASLPRPGGTPQSIKRPADAPQYKDLRDAFAHAANDPEILRIAAGDEN